MGRAAVLVVLVAACRSAPESVDAAASVRPPPSATAPVTAPSAAEDAPTEDASADAIFEASIRMLEEVATIVQDSPDDCDAIAQRLMDYYRRNQSPILVGHEKYDELSDDARAAVEAKYRKRYHAAWDKLRPRVRKCKGNENVNAAADRLLGRYRSGEPQPDPFPSSEPSSEP